MSGYLWRDILIWLGETLSKIPVLAGFFQARSTEAVTLHVSGVGLACDMGTGTLVPIDASRIPALLSLPLPNSGSPESVSIKDVFNDGKAEVMVVNKTSRLFVYDTDSLYGSDAPRQLEIGGSGDDTLTVADFDRDGIQDFVLFYASPKKGIPDNLAVHFGTGEHSGNFIIPPTEFSGIVRGNDGTYRRTYKDGTVAVFNPEGFQTAVIDSNGNTTTYDARGLRLTMRDERANVTTNAYDDYGRLISVTDPKGTVTSYTRDAAGNPSVTVRGNGTPEQQIELAFFDSKNRRIFSIDGEGGQTQIVYDAAGNVAKTVDATKISVSNIYDDRSRLSSIADPAAGTTSVIYDANDNIAAITAADGERKTLVYDAVNRVSEMTDAVGNVSRIAYDVRDNVIAITDGRGNTTTFAYDALDRLVSRTNTAGNVWAFEYDQRDYRKAIVKPDGTRVAFEYDALGRLIAAGAADEDLSKRRFAYDGAGNLIYAIVGNEAAEQLSSVFGYDQLDRIISEQASGVRFPSWSFTYEYDALGRRVALRDAAGAVTRYLYDMADRLSGMTLPSGKALGFSSDAAGRRTDMRFPNGLSLSARYETPSAGGSGGMTGRLSSVAHGLDAAGAGGSALNQKLGTVSYAYNVKGDITGVAETATPPRIRNSGYDAISRLVSVTDGGGELVESYTLDAEGNRLTSHMSKLHLTDPANRLVDDERHEFEYDVNGNLIRKTVKASGLTWRYGYSAYDELVLVSRHASASTGAPAALTITYGYDALARRVWERRQDASGTETSFRSFLHDGEHVAAEADVDSAGVASEPRRYSHTDGVDDLAGITLAAGAGGVPSSTATATGANAPSASSYYVHTDHLGSVRAVTDDAGSVVNEYSYDSYGQPETAVETVPQPFRFTGREYDPETGLSHYRSRAYDPSTSRFLQEDPIWFEAGDLNVYRYVWSWPANWTDPSGMAAAADTGATLSVSGALLSADHRHSEHQSGYWEGETRLLQSLIIKPEKIAHDEPPCRQALKCE